MIKNSYHYLIIGNGAAGLSAAEIIRSRDPHGRITIFSKEPYLFYSRPGIAYYIMGQITERQLISRNLSFYKHHHIDLRFGTISRLDLAGQLAFTDSGEPLAYDALLLATGSSAVRLNIPGSDLDGVVTFDTLDDAKRIVKLARRARSAVVAGGGITAMELAEGFQHLGSETHLLQRRGRIWATLFDEGESSAVEREIRNKGIVIHYNEEIEEIIGKKGKVTGVRLKSGRIIKCQVVGIAVGVRPNLQLVADQPVRLDKGIIVNQAMQSSMANLFAAGDVAQVYDRWTGIHNLDILWPSAIREGRVAGANMVEAVHGRSLCHTYQKESPFNCAMLFGLHLTVIGRVGSANGSDVHEMSYLSRGSSHVWTLPLSANYRSAWDHRTPTSLRIVMENGQIAGAVLIGNQELADPLRRFIEQGVDLSYLEAALLRGGNDLPGTILRAWRDWHQRW